MSRKLAWTIAALMTLGVSIACDDDDPPPSGGDPRPAGDPGSGGDPGTGPTCPWQPLGGQVSPTTAESEDPAMLLVGAAPAVGYRHASFEVNLHSWNGTIWTIHGPDPASGNSESSIHRAPDFCSRGDEVFVAYAHSGDSGASDGTFYDRIFVQRWTSAGGWVAFNSGGEVSQLWDSGRGIGYDAYEPAIACRSGSDPAVAWIETDITAELDIDLFVARVTPTSVARSPRINRVATQITDGRTTDIELAADGTAYAAHFEHVADASFATGLFVTRADGTALGGAIDQDENSNGLSAPSLVVIDANEIYVAWSADRDDSGTRDVYVSRWNGSAWNPLGGGPVSAFGTDHYDAANPDLILADGVLTLAWQEANDNLEQVFAAQWNGTTWDVLCGPVNVDPARTALDPSLAFEPASGTLYVAFEEMVDGWPQVFVEKLEL